MNKLVCSFAIAVLICAAAPARSVQSDTPEKIPQQLAEIWLPLLDAQKYGESWEQLSQDFKEKCSKDQWKLDLTGMRGPLGKLKERKFLVAIYVKSLKPEGHPDQEGVQVRFETTFENRASVRESVTTIQDKDGKWRVIKYSLTYDVNN